MNDISEVKVMKSAAGYYLGRGYNDMGSTGHPFPYTRLSSYYSSEADAESGLVEFYEFVYKPARTKELDEDLPF
jgi:hypothetical protein